MSTLGELLEDSMMLSFAVSFGPRLRRMQLSLLLLALTCLVLPVAVQAQVTFDGRRSVNAGSEAVGSTSAVVSLPFTIEAGTKVGSIAVLTTGIAGMDFAPAKKSTCEAKTYTVATHCVVNLTFTPLASGMRMGAAVFYSRGHDAGPVLATVPVFGIGTGPQLVFGPGGAATSVGSKFVSPRGVAVDAAGNLYISDTDLQEVFKVTPTGTQTTVGSGLMVPQGLAVDGAGNVYIGDVQAGVVYKVTPGGVQTTVGSGFYMPMGVAVDGAGNVYVCDPWVDGCYQITPGGAQNSVGGGYNTPEGVAVDGADNVYVADPFNAAVFKITPDGTQTTVGSFIAPQAVAVDAAGNVYVTDPGNDTITELAPSGVQTTVSSGLSVPDGLALDGSGNLYVANTFHKQVMKIQRADAPSLTFEPTKVGSTSKDSPKTVEVENIGNASLQFSSLTYATDFPEGTLNNDCTASTSLGTASTCALSIDFTPVKPLSNRNSRVLKEAVRLTTNTLNLPDTREIVVVAGKETSQ
jgi:large repetitive protein